MCIRDRSIPLLTRQIPFYILVYPTNRSDYDLFHTKSRLATISDDGSMTRTLKCKTSIVPEFSKSQTNKFVRVMTDGKDAVDVLGEPNTQTRITKVVSDDKVFKTGYKSGTEFIAADTVSRTRIKTGFRLIKEIITELNTNYLLELNSIGKSVTEFDVFSRLYLGQFSRLSTLENYKVIRDSIRNGFIEGVKVIPPIKSADNNISFRNTLLVRRKADAPEDTFKSVKATRSRNVIVAPTTTAPASVKPVPSPTSTS